LVETNDLLYAVQACSLRYCPVRVFGFWLRIGWLGGGVLYVAFAGCGLQNEAAEMRTANVTSCFYDSSCRGGDAAALGRAYGANRG
jgi:hypothetical protein